MTETQIIPPINTFENIDCMKMLRKCPNKHFDLAIVDPPYGLPKDAVHASGKLKDRIINREDITIWDKKPNKNYFDELMRVSQNQIIWGGNYFELPPTRGIICWDKVQPWDNFSQVEIAWTSFSKPASLFKYDNRTGDKIHPTQKPIALYKWILKRYAREGDKILDTHVGSGSSLVACIEGGFNYYGCEINKDYYEAASKRIARATRIYDLDLEDSKDIKAQNQIGMF